MSTAAFAAGAYQRLARLAEPISGASGQLPLANPSAPVAPNFGALVQSTTQTAAVDPASAVAPVARLAPSALSINAGTPDFGALVQQITGSIGDAGRAGDARIAQTMQGRGDVVDMVTAVAESEMAIQTLVSVRDRVIAAYEEIMRMPI